MCVEDIEPRAFSSECSMLHGSRLGIDHENSRARLGFASICPARCGSHFLQGVTAIFLIARSSRRCAYIGHRRALRSAKSHTASWFSVSARAGVVLRAIAAVARAPAATVSKASLSAAACSGAQAEL